MRVPWLEEFILWGACSLAMGRRRATVIGSIGDFPQRGLDERHIVNMVTS
jgi:hypothetical protein